MVVGICRCKDERDVIEFTVKHMLTQVDHVLVEDNGSTDGTLEILKGLPIDVLHDGQVAYYQAKAMTRLAAHAAYMYHATVVVPFDADEIWYSPFGTIREIIDGHPTGSIFTAKLYHHVATGQDPIEDDPTVRIGWRRRDAAPLLKVAASPRPALRLHQGNHSADYGETVPNLLVVRHFPYRTVEQFVSKVRNGAAAYAATDLPEDVGKHWRDYGRLLEAGGPEAIGDVFRAWFHAANPERDATLIYDPAPVTSCPSPS